MICSFCGHNNESGVNFCARCGAQLLKPQQTDSPANDASFRKAPDYSSAPTYRETQGNRDTSNHGNTPGYGYTQGHGNTPGYGYTQGHGGNTPGYKNAQGYGNDTSYRDHSGYGDTDDYDAEKSSISGIMKKLPNKKVLAIAASVVVLIIAAIIFIPMLGNSSGSTVKDSIAFFEDRGEVIISGNNNPKFTIDGNIESQRTSTDGSKAVIMTEYSYRNGGTLWFATTSASALIADSVYAYVLADSGNGVAYFTDYDERNSMATLYLYDTSSKKATLITQDAYCDGGTMPGVAISPDGKSVCYISDYDERKSEYTGYLKIDGKAAEKLGDEMFAVAISDGGKYIYYCKVDTKTESASLHVISGRNENRLMSDVYGISIMLNKDYSEAMFDLDSRTFISRRGNERERISGPVIQHILLPRGSQVGYFYGSSPYTGINVSISGAVYGISSFSNFIAITDDGLVYYDKSLEMNKISNSDYYASEAQISSDGKTLYFINNSDRLSSVNPTLIGADRHEIDRNVVTFVASGDGKSVYYVNSDNELYYASSSGAPIKISDDVYYLSMYGRTVSTGFLAMSYSGNRVFFLVDYRESRGGELYYSNNGGRKTKIAGADEVMLVMSTPANIFYVSRDSELFRSNGNERFIKFQDEIDIDMSALWN